MRFRDHPQVIGLAEFMNFPGVLAGDPGCIAKLVAFQDGHIDGHAPLLSGPTSTATLRRHPHRPRDHGAEEAREKLAKGMTVLIREGSVSKDLAALAKCSDETSPFLALCTDDRNPLDIAEEGHLDYMIRTLIARGRRRCVYRAASFRRRGLSGCRPRPDRAGLARRHRLLDDLEACPSAVIAAGRLVDRRCSSRATRLRRSVSKREGEAGFGRTLPRPRRPR